MFFDFAFFPKAYTSVYLNMDRLHIMFSGTMEAFNNIPQACWKSFSFVSKHAILDPAYHFWREDLYPVFRDILAAIGSFFNNIVENVFGAIVHISSYLRTIKKRIAFRYM